MVLFKVLNVCGTENQKCLAIFEIMIPSYETERIFAMHSEINKSSLTKDVMQQFNELECTFLLVTR